MLRREDDEFDAPLEDITNDADGPPGRTEIGYQTEVIDKMDEEEMGMDDERFGIDDMATEVGYLHDGGSEGRSGTQTEMGFDPNEDRGDFDSERDVRAEHMAAEQARRGGGSFIGRDGISGEQDEIGYLHDGGSEGRSGSQTELGFDPNEDRGDFGDERGLRAVMMAQEQARRGGGSFPDGLSGGQDEIGYLTEGFEGRSGEQTEIGEEAPDHSDPAGRRRRKPPAAVAPKKKSWWRRLFGISSVGGDGISGEQEEIGHGGGHGHGGGGHGHGGHGHGGGGRGRGGGWWGGGPWFDGPWYSDGYEIDDEDADQPAVVLAVIEQARDNRTPPPKMAAVDPDAPAKHDADTQAVVGTCIGIAAVTNVPDPTPLFSKLLQRFGAGGSTRLVRVDTEDSYAAFRAESSPEMAELHNKIADLTQRLDEHIADPEAHEKEAFNYEELDEVVAIGAAADAADAQKRVDLWLPRRFDGQWQAWREGDHVCASIRLPGADGEVRICTSLEPIRRCVEEMAHHASEAGVPTTAIGGVLPAMGCVLGAGTIMKEMAAAAPAILARPEAAHQEPFMVRIEPKSSPALCALAALAWECKSGNEQACTEWQLLAEAASPPVKQAMREAVELIKAEKKAA